MDKELEEIIINRFFVKRLRKRVLFELSSPKKRNDHVALSRLCHNYTTTLLEKYMIEIPKPNSYYMDIQSLLISYGAGETCYVISWDQEIDGKHLPLEMALERVVGLGMPSLVSCIPGKLAYFESEQCYGPPPRYILKREY